MPLPVQVALLLAFAALLVVILRAEWLPVAVMAVEPERSGPKRPEEGGDDEQLPETDRAPRAVSHLLTYAVALTAVVRLGVLAALHR
jgi:hypothetical protein